MANTPAPCPICGHDTKSAGYVYGVCDVCAQRAIYREIKRHENKRLIKAAMEIRKNG